ncbi:uncharacterized protein LOC128222824 [Mya arenaria]|uniref:uncharacterized protein LOC128222824 n=1 Tax=Mya arenaria TaxID=6604 RepID=UPI0022E982BC|nr:uncharacterized protein LOC128222824 [Mya arenaria]
MIMIHSSPLRMRQFILFGLLHFSTSCPFPDGFSGVWITSSQGTWTVNSTHITVDSTLDAYASIADEFECIENDTYNGESVFVVKSTATFKPFALSGDIYASWMCLRVVEARADAYYVYFNSLEEDYYSGQRIHGYKVTDTIAAVNVCTEAVPDELFEPFIRNGTETTGDDQCPDSLLGYYFFNYITSSGTVDCSSNYTGFIASCEDQNKTKLQVNTTSECAANPFSTTDGQLGCLFSFNTSTDGNNIILMLYNKDSGATSPFFCMVIDNLNNDTKTSASVSPSLCASGQNASAVPTSGFRLELSANETCKQIMSVPLSTTTCTESSGRGMFAFLHTIFFALCVYCFIRILF